MTQKPREITVRITTPITEEMAVNIANAFRAVCEVGIMDDYIEITNRDLSMRGITSD